jgi:hypothetical protein
MARNYIPERAAIEAARSKPEDFALHAAFSRLHRRILSEKKGTFPFREWNTYQWGLMTSLTRPKGQGVSKMELCLNENH